MIKKLIISVILAVSLIGVGLTTTGCKTVPSVETQKKIENSVKIASQIGGAIVLTEHPEYKAGFEQAITDLKIVANSPDTVGIQQVLAIVQRLNVKELKSPQAILYINSGILLITTFGVPTEFPLAQSESVKGIANALADGLKVAVQTVFPPQ